MINAKIQLPHETMHSEKSVDNSHNGGLKLGSLKSSTPKIIGNILGEDFYSNLNTPNLGALTEPPLNTSLQPNDVDKTITWRTWKQKLRKSSRGVRP